MENWLDYDIQILHLINNKWTTPFLDSFFPFITDLNQNKILFPILLILALAFVIYKHRARAAIYTIGLILSLAFNDFVAGKFIKPLFSRLRPSEVGLQVVLRAPHYGGYSFVSNHAANMFCLAFFIFYFHKRWGYVFLAWAALIAYSRVYCGVHYPSDVIGGAIWGALIGISGAATTSFAVRKSHG